MAQKTKEATSNDRKAKHIPSTDEIVTEVKLLKEFMKGLDFQMGIWGSDEKKITNKLNKIIRMLKCPMRKVNIQDIIGKPKKIKSTIFNKW